MIAVSLEMSDEPNIFEITKYFAMFLRYLIINVAFLNNLCVNL